MQMLRADLVERSLVSAFQHRPERLDAVGVRHAVDVLGNRVLDALMRVRDAFVGRRVVGVDHSARLGILGDEAVQGILVRALDHAGVDLVGGPILRADHRRHVHRAASGGFGPLGVRLVLALAAKVGLVELYWAVERAFAVTVSLRWCPMVMETPISLAGNYTRADVVAVYRLYKGFWIDKSVELSVIGRDHDSREVRLAGGDWGVVAWNPGQMDGL